MEDQIVEYLPKRMDERRPAILFVINRWPSLMGGIQTVNRRLAEAVAASYGGLEVLCAVPRVTEREIEDADRSRISLVWSRKVPYPDVLEPTDEEWAGLRERLRVLSPSVIAVVGHHDVSSTRAQDLRDRLFPDAKLAQFVHTTPDEAELAKVDSLESDTKASQEARQMRPVLAAADVAACVGPRVVSHIRGTGFVRSERILRIGCGIEQLPPFEPPSRPNMLFVGRTKYLKLKGLDLFARAAGVFMKHWREGPYFGVNHEETPVFTVRGSRSDWPTLADDLRDLAATAGYPVRFRVRNYTSEPDELDNDLRAATVLVMASRAEPFGLVAAEAISRGVPVIVSDSSGIGVNIREIRDQHFFNIDHVLVDPDAGEESVAEEIAGAMAFVVAHEKFARDRVVALSRLLLDRSSWRTGAEQLIDRLAPEVQPTHYQPTRLPSDVLELRAAELSAGNPDIRSADAGQALFVRAKPGSRDEDIPRVVDGVPVVVQKANPPEWLSAEGDR